MPPAVRLPDRPAPPRLITPRTALDQLLAAYRTVPPRAPSVEDPGADVGLLPDEVSFPVRDDALERRRVTYAYAGLRGSAHCA